MGHVEMKDWRVRKGPQAWYDRSSLIRGKSNSILVLSIPNGKMIWLLVLGMDPKDCCYFSRKVHSWLISSKRL